MQWFVSLAAFSFPSLFVRIFLRKDGKVRGLVQDLFAGAQLGSLALIVPWVVPLVQLLIFYDGWVSKKVHFRLEVSCLSFLTQLKDFKDSAKDLKVFHLLPLFLIGALPCYFAKPLPLESLIVGFPLLYFRTNLATDQLLILWEKQIFASITKLFKKGEGDYHPFVKKELLSSQEIYSAKSPKYPLFRYTHGFKGEKTFDIPLRLEEKPHVMFLTIESFRGKDFGAMGSDKGVTPHLDALAETAHLFSHFYANSFPTFRSFFTTLFGLPYVLEMKTVLDINFPTYGIPELLKEHGYETNYFTGGDWGIGGLGPFIRQMGADRIFDRKDVQAFAPDAEGASWGLHDEYLLGMTLDHFEKNQSTPQFYYVLTTSSHHPWIVPEGYTPPPLEHIKDHRYRNYLQTLHYTDAQVGHFIHQLRERNLTKNLILFITGDHGVAFDEGTSSSDYLGYGQNDLFHVPLMIYAEGRTGNAKQIDAHASQCDLLPTLMDLLNIKGYQHSIGRSLLRKEENPRVFFHKSFKVTGSIFCRENRGSGEYNKFTKEFSGANPELYPLLETFGGMLSALYEQKLLVPEEFQKKGKQLSIEPQRISSELSREDLEKEIYKKSPMASLTLSNNHHLNDDLLTKITQWNPDLDLFHVNGSYSLTNESLGYVLKGCNNLYNLNISDCLLLTERCLDLLPENIMHLTLSGLDFVSDKSFTRQFKYLEKLNIQETPLTSRGLRRFPELFPGLSHLLLSYTHFDIEAIETVLDNLPLKYLSISEGGSLTVSDAKRVFKKHPTLQYLILHGCSQLTDEVFESIEDTDLWELYLHDVPRLTDRGLEAILKLPIETLHIDGAPNLTENAFNLLDRYRDKFVNISVRILNNLS